MLASYRITPNLATAELPFFLVYSRDPNLPLHQFLEPMFNHYTSFIQMLLLSYIYMSLTSFPNIFLIPRHLRIFQNINQHQHGDCRILADGMKIWHLECHFCFTSVLGRRPRPDHPRCSLRTCLQPLLLDFNQPHSTPLI